MGNLGDWIGVFLIIAVLFGNGGLFGGGNENTRAIVDEAISTQTTQSGIRDVLLSSANNNYETAQLINAQTNAMLQQNNTNLINAIQGFNQVNLNIQNQTNVLSNQLQSLGAQLNECCCSIKTQMLNDRLADTQAQLVAAQNAISNANQSQYLLSQLGKFVPTTAAGA